ncbi:MAG: prepilin-type N-terminal cleavage/methylation domain-containing protein [Azoarcus sp.]|jgi:general secretion pathway protein J|nr:prepilin-type N-terminal cleavage/methylation domain-containing protein [Azoarcus sp.]
MTFAPIPVMQRPGARGFTLVEVIIALALISLIMLGLVSAFATLGKTAARLDEHAGRSGREWLVGELLRATLSSAIGQIKYTLPDQRQTIYFRGDTATVQWLGSMPARHGAGGLHLFMLGLESCAGRSRSSMCLALRYTPYVREDSSARVAASPQTQVLAENVSDFRIAYQSHPARVDEQAVWRGDWTDADKLPARVRIELAVGGAPWPPMAAPLGAIDAAGGKRVQFQASASPSPPWADSPQP